ncbi:E3 ubiquitin-protein ligase sina-like, partial [Centruroides vittatus]|uniref:E3 ubiquitin-protein ligase sina-like n=1 Tax=Centruroides vittatus TaxID=120091 RepID=UPI00350FACD3
MAAPGQDPALTTLLSCPICYTVVHPPVYQCTNGHIVCSSCRQRITTCPTCRETLGHIRSLVAEQIASTLQLPCTNESYGCTALLKEADRATHENTCPFRPVDCPFTLHNCNWKGELTNVLSHIQQEHKQVPLLRQASLIFM